MSFSDSPEVGSGHVAIVPTFKGFRESTGSFVDGVTKDAGSRFTSGFRSTGAATGKAFSDGFRSGGGDALVKQATDAVSASAKAVAAARLKEQDAAGKVRVAEAALADTRARYADDSVQVVRAEERLASTQRGLVAAQDNLLTATDRLTASKLGLAHASEVAASESNRVGSSFAALPGRLGAIGKDAASKFGTGFSQVLGGLVGANLITGAGFALGRGISDAVFAGIDFTKGSISLASDLNETTSAVTQVFGSAAKGIVAFSKTADQRLGQTRQEALLGAQTFGVFGRAAGLQGPELTNFSTGLVQLATDLASFYNTTPDDATEALSAGLRGESEPLRRYGVLLDDVTLKAEAAKLGLLGASKSSGELAAAQVKVEKAQKAASDATKKYGASSLAARDANAKLQQAQDALAETVAGANSGPLTQQQRILAANALIFEQSGIAQGDFSRTSSGLANSQRILNAEIQDTQAKLGGYLLPGFTRFVGYADSTLLPKFGEVIDRVGPKLEGALKQSAPAVKELLDKAGPLADKFGDMAADSLPQVVGFLGDIADRAPAAVDALNHLFKVLNSPAANHAADFTFGAAGGSANMFLDPDFWNQAFSDSAKKRFDKKSAEGQYGVIWGWFNSWWNPFADGVDKAVSDLWNATFAAPGRKGVGNKGDKKKPVEPSDVIDVSDPGWAKSGADAVGAVNGGAQGAASSLYGTGALLSSNFQNGVASNTGPVTAQGFNLSAAAAQGAQSNAGALSQAGADAAKGFSDGVLTRLDDAAVAARALANQFEGTLKKQLLIQSPSKKLRLRGQQTAEGFALGIEDRTGRVTSAAGMLSAAAQTAVGPSISGGGGSSSGLPSTVVLRVGDREFTAYVDERADGRVSAYDADQRGAQARGSRGF